MRKSVFTLVTVLSAFFFITSCQKELSFEGIDLPSKSDSLIGDWKFVSMDVKSNLNSVQNVVGNIIKLEYITDFLTKNNGGTLNIDSFNLNLADFTYSIDTVTKINAYLNNTLADSDEMDAIYDEPPFTTSSEYQVIGKDSLYLPNADFINLPIDLVVVPPVTGFKFKFEGDKLILSTFITISEVDNTSVPPTTYTSSATVVITFQKQ